MAQQLGRQTVIGMVVVLALGSAANSQTPTSPAKAPSAAAPTALDTVKAALMERHRLNLLYLHGVRGRAIDGLFSALIEQDPSNTTLADGSDAEPSDPETVARDFIDQEAELFGSDGPADFRLWKLLSDDSANRHLIYRRYVEGLRLDGAEIRVHLDRNGKVYAIDGRVVPISADDESAIFTRLAASRLEKPEVADLIARALAEVAMPSELEIRSLEKLALARPPYIIWKAEVVSYVRASRWDFEVDASTGQILATDATGNSDPMAVENSSTEVISSVPGSRYLSHFVAGEKQLIPATNTSPFSELPWLAPREGVMQELRLPLETLRESKSESLYASSPEAAAKREVDGEN